MLRPGPATWSLLWQPYLSLRGLRPYWNELVEFRRVAPAVRRRVLGERLLRQIRHFAGRPEALPAWVDAARVSNADELWAVWPGLPILTKADLRGRFAPDRMLPHLPPGGVSSVTGGSTGEPTPYHHDRPMRLATSATMLFARRRLGWRPGMPLVILWGAERDIGKARSFAGRMRVHLQNHHLVDGYQLDDGTVDTVSRLVRRHGPCAVWGFSSMLDFVARRLLELGRAAPEGQVRTAWNGGEMLYPEQSARFRQAFGLPILNFYGGRELGAMAVQTSENQPLEVLRPFLMVEVVDEEGSPCPPGVPGRLIWTSTVCRGTPFLRYDVGDMGVCLLNDGDEAGVLAIRELQGRSAGLLTLPDGRTLNCLFWNHLFKEFPTVHQFQVRLRGVDGVHIRLKGQGFTTSDAARLEQVLRPLFGAQGVETTWVPSIPLSRQGKLEQVVRE